MYILCHITISASDRISWSFEGYIGQDTEDIALRRLKFNIKSSLVTSFTNGLNTRLLLSDILLLLTMAFSSIQEPFAAYVDYTADLEIFKTEKPYELYQVEGLPQSDLTNVVYEPHNIACQLEDIRGRESNFSLHEHSFCYMKHTSQVPVVEEDDMMHPYATEVNGLLKQMFNTPHVICYDVRVSIIHS